MTQKIREKVPVVMPAATETTEQTQVFEEEEEPPEEKPKEEPDEQEEDDFADGLVYWKNNPNVTMCQGKWDKSKRCGIIRVLVGFFHNLRELCQWLLC